MTTLNPTSLKVVSCALAALAVTSLMSWSFVESTAIARWVGNAAVATLVASAGDDAGARRTQSSSAALLD